jgi:hypothetical protein
VVGDRRAWLQQKSLLVIDIKKYVNTPLRRFEYMVINLSMLPQEIFDEHNLLDMAHDRRVYIEIQKGMYGSPQAGIFTNDLLQRRLAVDGYHPTEHRHGLWKHETCLVWFSLVVDGFGIKYMGRKNVEHLMASIKKKCEFSSDRTGSAYCWLKIDWDYANGMVDLYMPGHIKAALHKYQHPAPRWIVSMYRTTKRWSWSRYFPPRDRERKRGGISKIVDSDSAGSFDPLFKTV